MSWLFILFLAELVDTVLTKCPIGTVQGLSDDACYLYQWGKSSWYEAEDECVQRGGHLASVSNGLVNSFIPRQACPVCGDGSGLYWLGGSTTGEKKWTWSDGNRFSFAHWANGQPLATNDLYCLALNISSSNWYAASCDDAKPFVCKLPALPKTSVEKNATHTTSAKPPARCVPHPSPCPSGWVHYAANFKCYKQSLADGFYGVLEECQRYGGSLASIHSYDLNQFLTGHFAWAPNIANSNEPYIWIGLYDPMYSGVWQWTDASIVNYTIWSPKEPSGDGRCVNMYGYKTEENAGRWNDLNCESVIPGICEIPAWA